MWRLGFAALLELAAALPAWLVGVPIAVLGIGFLVAGVVAVNVVAGRVRRPARRQDRADRTALRAA